MRDLVMTRTGNTVTDATEMLSFEVCVTSGEKAVRGALEQIFKKLQPLALDAEERAIVELVLAEALNNIIEHAYPAEAAQGAIRIACKHQQTGLHFSITDMGKPMPEQQLPLGKAQSLDVDYLNVPEGGYGWFLIKDLAQEVHYQRKGSQNQLDLRIAVAIR